MSSIQRKKRECIQFSERMCESKINEVLFITRSSHSRAPDGSGPHHGVRRGQGLQEKFFKAVQNPFGALKTYKIILKL